MLAAELSGQRCSRRGTAQRKRIHQFRRVILVVSQRSRPRQQQLPMQLLRGGRDVAVLLLQLVLLVAPIVIVSRSSSGTGGSGAGAGRAASVADRFCCERRIVASIPVSHTTKQREQELR